MEKALNVLKDLCLVINFNSYWKPIVEEAIAELEEAMKPKTCDGCCWWNDFWAKCDNHDNSLAGVNGYCCNRYEAKESK